MDSTLLRLFNNGDNDGTIVIVSPMDNVEIRCHKWLVQYQAKYFTDILQMEKEAKRRKLGNNSHQKIIRIVWNVRSIVIKQAINFLYNSHYVVDNNLEAKDCISLFHLIRQLQLVQNTTSIMDNIFGLFYLKLSNDNWFDLLQETHADPSPLSIPIPTVPFSLSSVRKNFFILVTVYYMNNITSQPDFFFRDPLNDLNMNLPLGKTMIAFYRLWINRCRNMKVSAVSKPMSCDEVIIKFMPTVPVPSTSTIPVPSTSTIPVPSTSTIPVPSTSTIPVPSTPYTTSTRMMYPLAHSNQTTQPMTTLSDLPPVPDNLQPISHHNSSVSNYTVPLVTILQVESASFLNA